jgi:hypothetical protein
LNDLRQDWGLAAHDHIDKAEIFGLPAATEVLSQIPADHSYTAREGQGIVASRAAVFPGKFDSELGIEE